MALRFTGCYKPTAADQLTDLQKRQLREAGKRYDGQLLPVRERFESDDEEAVLQFLEIWQVEDDGKHVHDAYFYMVDSGTVFRRGTLEVVAEMIQCYFDHPADEPLRQQLQAAYREASQPRRKPAATKTAKKPATKKTAKKSSTKKSSTKKPSTKKPAKKSSTKKTAKKSSTKKTATKKSSTKKPAKKSSTKKTATKKSSTKKSAKKSAATTSATTR